ncbi:MAG: nucleoside recognition protein [Christensenellaceae bacterium]|nr:nucleoside recognition protein [Christensenellaceae bacterium]
MSAVFTVLIGMSLLYGLFCGKAEAMTAAVFASAETAAETVISMLGSYAFWLGLLNVAKESGIVSLAARLMRPLMKKLFPGSSKEAHAYVTLNFVANFFGMGNAATPFGLRAAKELEKGEDPDALISMFMAINTSAVQLIPMGVIALRQAAGSLMPADILLPTFLVSLAGLVFAVMMALFARKKEKKDA